MRSLIIKLMYAYMMFGDGRVEVLPWVLLVWNHDLNYVDSLSSSSLTVATPPCLCLKRIFNDFSLPPNPSFSMTKRLDLIECYREKNNQINHRLQYG